MTILAGRKTIWYLFYNITLISINQLMHRLLQILPFDWLSYSLCIGDRPLVAKLIDFQIQNNGRKLTFCRGFSLFLENNILSN